MKNIALILVISLLAGVAISEETEVKRPRDRYVKASPVDEEGAKRMIGAIETYRKILSSKDYKRFYRECVHSALKKRVSEEQFAAQIATVPETLGKFFDDILETYAKKGGKDEDFQIGEMPSSLVEGSVMIQFADRIDAEPEDRWPEGAPVRIQMAEDDGSLRFYDID